MKFEQAQISRKPPQVGGQTRYKRAQAKNLRWLAFSFDKVLRYYNIYIIIYQIKYILVSYL